MDSYTITQTVFLVGMILGILILFACAAAVITGLVLGVYFEKVKSSDTNSDTNTD